MQRNIRLRAAGEATRLLAPPDPVTRHAALADMMEPNPRNDITLPALSALATLKAEKALPIDAMEPTLPIDPMDNVEERLQILSIESCDAIDHRDDMTVSLPQHSARVCTTGHEVQRRSADTLIDGIKHHAVGNLHTVDLVAD